MLLAISFSTPPQIFVCGSFVGHWRSGVKFKTWWCPSLRDGLHFRRAQRWRPGGGGPVNEPTHFGGGIFPRPNTSMAPQWATCEPIWPRHVRTSISRSLPPLSSIALSLYRSPTTRRGVHHSAHSIWSEVCDYAWRSSRPSWTRGGGAERARQSLAV